MSNLQVRFHPDPGSPPADLRATVGPFFRAEYSLPPWDERWRCPNCSDPADYGPTGRYSEVDLSTCPVCATTLEPYWSDDRTAAYLTDAMSRQGSWLIIVRDEADELAGWCWGYDFTDTLAGPPLSSRARYADIVGVMRQHRGSGSAQVVAECTRLMHTAPPGYGPADTLMLRTHRSARHLHVLLARNGWRRWSDLVSPDDPDREYWSHTQGA